METQRRRLLLKVFAVVAIALTTSPTVDAQSSCAGASIDDFSLDQAQISLFFPPPQFGSSLSDNSPTILGMEREMFVELNAAGMNGANAVGVSNSKFFYAATNTITGRFRLIYDGDDDDLGVLSFTSLTADLTAAGGSRFALLADVDSAIRIHMRVYTSATLYSDLADAAGGAGTPGFPLVPTGPFELYVIPYANFATGAGAAGPANFAEVHAMEVTVEQLPRAILDLEFLCVQVDLIFGNGFD